jgi:hypothetical protein
MAKHVKPGRAFAALVLLGLLASAGRGQVSFTPSVHPETEPPESAASAFAAEPAPPHDVAVWGLAEFRGFAVGEKVGPNGLEYKPLFNLDLDFNFWLWRSQRVYLFNDALFWGQRATPGVTNSNQGILDFSKREFDLYTGAAWNCYGPFEARAFVYSFSNLNRGKSAWHPSDFLDGVGLEGRYYLNPTYAALGTDAFDQARATFLSAGFYPSKDMVDSQGIIFRPGPFARANLTLDLIGEWCYLYGDGQFLGTRSSTPKWLKLDAGLAVRPWEGTPRVEFRFGTDDLYDLRSRETETNLYAAIRLVY